MCLKCIQLSSAVAGIFWENKINTIAADALAPYIARTSTAMVLTMQVKQVCLPWQRISITCAISMSRNDRKYEYIVIFLKQFSMPSTVGTPYNTAPYITGSNIARLGHGSQNSWSKLWIPVVKSAPVRVIFAWKSVPKKRIHGSSDIYLGTQWKQRHDSLWSYRLDVIVTFLWYDTISTI